MSVGNTKPFLRVVSAALLLCFVATFRANARVYRLLGKTEKLLHTLHQAGARQAYSAPISLNGGDAQLTIMGSAKPLEALLPALQKALGDAKLENSGGILRSRSQSSEGVIRVVLLPLTEQGQTLAFLIEQTSEEAARTDRGGVLATMPHVPSFPDAEAQFSATDKEVNMTLNVLRTSAGVDAVQAWYDDALTTRGWVALAPPSTQPASGLQIFARGKDVCCVYVGAERTGGQNTIALLHKQPGIE